MYANVVNVWGKRKKGEGRREKGEWRREKGEGRKGENNLQLSVPLSAGFSLRLAKITCSL